MCQPGCQQRGVGCVQGMEAVARLRCSKGLTVEKYLGSFHRRTATDIDLPALHAEQSIAVQLRHEDKLDKEAFLQFVVLYSTTQGERRIRQAISRLISSIHAQSEGLVSCVMCLSAAALSGQDLKRGQSKRAEPCHTDILQSPGLGWMLCAALQALESCYGGRQVTAQHEVCRAQSMAAPEPQPCKHPQS